MGVLGDQVALVTGGGSGIGRAVVSRFIEEGARVGVLERVAGRAEELRGEFGDKVVGIPGDVAQLADNKRAVAETVRSFGRLDVFIGNAGIFDVYAPVADMPEEQLARAYDELFGVNVKGVIFGARAALPELAKTSGSMVFTASVAGLNSGGGGALYTASKHAVVGLIRELAVEANLCAAAGTPAVAALSRARFDAGDAAVARMASETARAWIAEPKRATATATTAIIMVHTAFISGFTPRRTSE